MEIPSGTRPALWGAAAGAVAMAVVGFSWAGWTTAGSAEALAKERASKAVAAALAPICAENFLRAADSASQLVELKKLSTWAQASFVEKGGWAKMPGLVTVDSSVTSACAEKILASKI